MTETPADAAVPALVLELARAARTVCVLTGAGMSAESGVPTFRDAQTGLWEQFDPMQLATPQAWAEDPEQVWAWYAWRGTLVRGSQPNAGHLALAEWQRRVDLRIVTQNVDDLHERAGASVLTHLHGALFAFRCAACGRGAGIGYPHLTEPVARHPVPECEHCGGLIRPGVVWFGEDLPPGAFEAAVESARSADLVLSVGTSGLVYPAAALPHLAGARGVPVVEINPHETGTSEAAAHCWRTGAAVALPALVAAL